MSNVQFTNFVHITNVQKQRESKPKVVWLHV